MDLRKRYFDAVWRRGTRRSRHQQKTTSTVTRHYSFPECHGLSQMGSHSMESVVIIILGRSECAYSGSLNTFRRTYSRGLAADIFRRHLQCHWDALIQYLWHIQVLNSRTMVAGAVITSLTATSHRRPKAASPVAPIFYGSSS